VPSAGPQRRRAVIVAMITSHGRRSTMASIVERRRYLGVDP
jgi:hypothetical protein